jgi:hypothetical protein
MSQHELTLGDICTVTGGKFKDKRVLVIKSGIQTKFGLKVITVEYHDKGATEAEKIWVSPEQLSFAGESDTETAEVIKEADFQEWKARKNAGVPPASQFKQKSWGNKGGFKKKSDGESDESF